MNTSQPTTNEIIAMIHYRALFEELAGMPSTVDSHPVQVVVERIETTGYSPRRRAS
jgi:hypothetical protein